MLDDLEQLTFLAVDIAKYRDAPQSAYVTRLLALLNDLDSIVFLSELVTQEMADYKHFLRFKWADGVRLFLLRQNVLVILEGLHHAITEMADKTRKCGKPQDVSEPLLLWHLIASNPDLMAQLNNLESITSSPESADVYRALRFVRDKLGGHIDVDILKRNLSRLYKDNDYTSGVMTRYEKSKSFRAPFVDDILSKAWQSEGIAGPESASITSYVKYVVRLREDLGCFAFALADKYIKQFKLEVTPEAYNEIAASMNEFDEKHHVEGQVKYKLESVDRTV